jgi:hypothetical protein
MWLVVHNKRFCQMWLYITQGFANVVVHNKRFCNASYHMDRSKWLPNQTLIVFIFWPFLKASYHRHLYKSKLPFISHAIENPNFIQIIVYSPLYFCVELLLVGLEKSFIILSNNAFNIMESVRERPRSRALQIARPCISFYVCLGLTSFVKVS